MRSDRLGVALLALLPGCTLGTVQSTRCSASSECRDAFGFGWECDPDGYCDAVQPSNRCDDPYPNDLFERPENYSDTIVIGALFDFDTALENLRSIELAFDEANIEGGLEGRDFAMVACNYTADLALDADDGETAAKKLTTWLTQSVGVPAIVGPGSSPRAQQIWPEASSTGTLLVAPSATSDILTAIDGETSTDEDPGLFWRTAPPDAIQAATIANDMESRAITSIAIIHQTGAYGEGLAEGIPSNLSLPGDIDLYPFDNSNQLTAAIGDAGSSDVDEVVFVSSDPVDVIAFLNGAAGTGGYGTKTLFLTDSARDGAVLEQASGAAVLFPRVRGTVPIADPEDNLDLTFYTAYSQRYGEDPGRDGFNTFSYDAAWITLYGVIWANYQEDGIEGLNIARGLRHISTAGAERVPLRAASWPDALESFQNGVDIDVYGASGSLDFDPVTGETSNPIAVWVISEPTPGDYAFEDELICDVDGTCTPAGPAL